MMKDKTFFPTVVITVALLGCLGIADAQSIPTEPPTAPTPITPELHNELLTKGGAVSNVGSMSSFVALTNGAVVANLVVGWNYIHPINCVSYWDGVNTWLYTYPQEGGGYFLTNILGSQTVIAPACQTGNWLAFYVYDAAGNWNQVFTFNFK